MMSCTLETTASGVRPKMALTLQQYYDNSFDVGYSMGGGTEKTSVHDRAIDIRHKAWPCPVERLHSAQYTALADTWL